MTSPNNIYEIKLFDDIHPAITASKWATRYRMDIIDIAWYLKSYEDSSKPIARYSSYFQDKNHDLTYPWENFNFYFAELTLKLNTCFFVDRTVASTWIPKHATIVFIKTDPGMSCHINLKLPQDRLQWSVSQILEYVASITHNNQSNWLCFANCRDESESNIIGGYDWYADDREILQFNEHSNEVRLLVNGTPGSMYAHIQLPMSFVYDINRARNLIDWNNPKYPVMLEVNDEHHLVQYIRTIDAPVYKHMCDIPASVQLPSRIILFDDAGQSDLYDLTVRNIKL